MKRSTIALLLLLAGCGTAPATTPAADPGVLSFTSQRATLVPTSEVPAAGKAALARAIAASPFHVGGLAPDAVGAYRYTNLVQTRTGVLLVWAAVFRGVPVMPVSLPPGRPGPAEASVVDVVIVVDGKTGAVVTEFSE